MTAPFRISADYIEWAHGPGAESGQTKAKALCALVDADPIRETIYIGDPELVREIASVAELYVGGSDNDLRAARVLKRARAWLARAALAKARP